MIWAGSTVYTLWGYQPVTRPAIKWIQRADGNWSGIDRGVAQDVYEAAVNFQGTEADLATLETLLAANRETFSATFGTGEEIFGADISYSGSITVAVVDYGKIQRVSFAQYAMPLRLRAIGPSFTGSASLASLRLSAFQYDTGSTFDLNKIFTQDGTGKYFDGETDPGIFKAVFTQTTAEMKAIRRYLLTTGRTASVSFPSFGVSEPFGQRMGTGPFNVKIIDWADQGRQNYIDWQIEITFARVI